MDVNQDHNPQIVNNQEEEEEDSDASSVYSDDKYSSLYQNMDDDSISISDSDDEVVEEAQMADIVQKEREKEEKEKKEQEVKKTEEKKKEADREKRLKSATESSDNMMMLNPGNTQQGVRGGFLKMLNRTGALGSMARGFFSLFAPKMEIPEEITWIGSFKRLKDSIVLLGGKLPQNWKESFGFHIITMLSPWGIIIMVIRIGKMTKAAFARMRDIMNIISNILQCLPWCHNLKRKILQQLDERHNRSWLNVTAEEKELAKTYIIRDENVVTIQIITSVQTFTKLCSVYLEIAANPSTTKAELETLDSDIGYILQKIESITPRPTDLPIETFQDLARQIKEPEKNKGCQKLLESSKTWWSGCCHGKRSEIIKCAYSEASDSKYKSIQDSAKQVIRVWEAIHSTNEKLPPTFNPEIAEDLADDQSKTAKDMYTKLYKQKKPDNQHQQDLQNQQPDLNNPGIAPPVM